MDPLSLTASVIAVAAAAAQIGSVFAELRKHCIELPGRLHALNNEVADIEVVLYQVAAAVNDRSSLPASDQTTIPQLLKQAKTKLSELNEIIERLAATCDRKKVILRASAWRKEQPKLQALQEDIKTVKCSLNIMLGASNSRDMIRVRLDLETLSTVTSRSAEDQTEFRDEVMQGLVRQQEVIMDSFGQNYQLVDQRLSRLEEMLNAQSAQMQANQSAKMGPLYSTSPPPSRRRRIRRSSKDSEPRSPVRSEGVGIRLSQYFSTVCRPGCSCVCHTQRRSATPGLVDRFIGQLFVGYTGLPLLSPKCDNDTCGKTQSAHVSVEYWFPLGFCWSQIIRLQVGYRPHLGPQLYMSTLRRVPDSAPCVNFALEGNIEGLKSLFKHGLASPRDVSSTRGYSVLRWALYGQQYETCKFLMSAGADPDYQPISPNDECPSEKACDIVLRGGLSREVVETLKCLTQGPLSDFIENQNFSSLHRIVLKLSLQDLEDEILQNADDVDVPDAIGRTALEWAAARGDEGAVVTLLSYGADPNSMDHKLNTPLTLAANQSQTVCVRLLLEAGADPEPILPKGIKFGSPLNCAARNASDPLLLKTLLDFNADIEASGVDGCTPLLHVARSNSASHAMVLLEYGADINVTSKAGQTPLTTAIAYNNHSVLNLLLDRWFEYSECPRLKGPHLLEFVAQYADAKTMSILASASHLKLKYDKDYVLDHVKTRLHERVNVTDELIAAFEELLDVVKQGPEVHHGAESLMEAGLLAHTESRSEKDEGKESGDDDESDGDFKDAQESFALTSNDIDIGCLAARLRKRATF